MTGVLQNPSVDSHVFGLDTSAMNNNKTATDNSAGNVTSLPKWTGVHNVNYRRYHDTGTETVTIFVNGIDGTASSWVYEFEVSLVPQLKDKEAASAVNDDDVIIDDSVFATRYSFGECPFLANAQGGARSISRSGESGQGVWLVGSGVSGAGLVCVDEAGGSVEYPAGGTDLALYDSFTFFEAAAAVR